MPLDFANFTRALAVAMLLTAAAMSVAYADDDDDEYKFNVNNAKWKSECGACHVAYPPGLLPAESWRAIMSGLDKHFGSNAGLDAASASEITAFLVKNARKDGRGSSGEPLLRITETRWFKSEHSEVAARHWNSPKVKSRANCGACHTTADSGDFSEDKVKIPR